MIIDGTNHYAGHEQTVESAHPVIRHHHTVAFSVLTDDGERLVVVAEHARDLADAHSIRDEVTPAVRAAVSTGHGVAIQDFILAQPGTVPRTTSGKVARGACREHYLQGVWSSDIQPQEGDRHRMKQAGGDQPVEDTRTTTFTTDSRSAAGVTDLRNVLARLVSDICGISPEQLDDARPLAEYGLTSRDAVGLTGELEKVLDRPLPATLLWEHPTIGQLVSTLTTDEHIGTVETQERLRTSDEAVATAPADEGAIAIVGIGCRLPGNVHGPDRSGSCSWRERILSESYPKDAGRISPAPRPTSPP